MGFVVCLCWVLLLRIVEVVSFYFGFWRRGCFWLWAVFGLQRLGFDF